jgi:hypothetical protein
LKDLPSVYHTWNYADLDLPLPFDEGDEQREGEEHQEHRQQMADR